MMLHIFLIHLKISLGFLFSSLYPPQMEKNVRLNSWNSRQWSPRPLLFSKAHVLIKLWSILSQWTASLKTGTLVLSFITLLKLASFNMYVTVIKKILWTIMLYDLLFKLTLKKFLLLQMILKMICALLAMLLEAFGVYGEGKFQWNYG